MALINDITVLINNTTITWNWEYKLSLKLADIGGCAWVKRNIEIFGDISEDMDF